MKRAAVLPILFVTSCSDIEAIEAPTPLEQLSPVDRARVELGQHLFFDSRLSADGTVACASCHRPLDGGDDGEPVSIGIGDKRGRRNAPTVLNAGFKQRLFWDGRADNLEQQALMPLRSPDEMGAIDGVVLAFLESDAFYSEAFERAFPNAALNMESVASALAAYERQLVTPSRVDAFLLGDEGALDESERRGLKFFRGNCVFCHDGPGVGGTGFQKLGDANPWPEDRTQDLGRFELTGDPDDRLVFAVPQLRNVARTSPYFHDGSVETLAEAVELMGRYQLDVELSEGEVNDLVAFLGALSADPDPRLLK